MTGRVVHVPTAAIGFADDRQWVSLQDACLGVFDCPHSTPVIVAEGPYVVRSQDIRTGRLDLATTARVSEATYQERIERAEPRAGDLLYSREGTYFGIAAEVPPDVRVCLGQRMVLIRPNPSAIVSRYLLYWLNSPIMAAQVAAFRDGSVAERLNMPTIRGLPVPLTDMDTQRRIADVLGALDDKIALNARMNATLEAMARAVFEDWFVRFGPVRAKAEGRAPPGLAPDIAALFPDRLTETPDGEMPEGWSFAPLSSAANQVRDTLNPGDFPGEVFAHFSLPAFDDGAEPERVPGRDIRSQKFAVPRDAVLLSKLNPVTPRVWLADYGETERAVASTEFLVLVAREGWSREWLYCQFVQPDFRIELQSLVTGTSNSHQRAQPQAIMALRVARPAPSVLTAFRAVVAPMLDRVLANRQETQTLTALRDLLLPRLISGQLRLRDAERAVEAAL
jgi:type I restriction enzyme S subunit